MGVKWDGQERVKVESGGKMGWGGMGTGVMWDGQERVKMGWAGKG